MNKGKRAGPIQRRHKAKKMLRKPVPRQSPIKTPSRRFPGPEQFPEVDETTPEE